MKHLYKLLLATILTVLPTSPEAAIASYPFTDEDLIRYGADPKFDGVHLLAFESEVKGSISTCSSVAIQTNLPFSIYLTAAHCTDLGRPYLMKDGDVIAAAHACFRHPLYEIASHDIAACYFSKDVQSSVRYPVHTKELDTILTQPLISVSVQYREDIDCPHQAFITAVERNDFWLYSKKSTALPLNVPSGRTTPGDSGGSLFYKDAKEQLHLVAILSKGVEVDIGADNTWFFLNKEFLDLITEVRPHVPPLAYTTFLDLTAQVKNLYLKKNPSLSWQQIVNNLQEQKELQYNIGITHYHKRDFITAEKWLRKSAVQGYALSQFTLASLYLEGKGVKKDLEEAFRWYEKAALQEHAASQYNLAFLYFNGYGTRKNPKEAAYWYAKAAGQGYALAQYKLANLYLTGEGVKQDLKEAFRLHEKAALQGNFDAQYELANMYLEGIGTQQSFRKALHWYDESVKSGNKDIHVKQAADYLREVLSQQSDL